MVEGDKRIHAAALRRSVLLTISTVARAIAQSISAAVYSLMAVLRMVKVRSARNSDRNSCGSPPKIGSAYNFDGCTRHCAEHICGGVLIDGRLANGEGAVSTQFNIQPRYAVMHMDIAAL